MYFFSSFNKRIKHFIKKYLPQLIITILIAIFIFVYLFHSIFYRIGPGEGGVYYKLFDGGTVIDKVYNEGIHIIWPWNKMYIYNLRKQQIKHDVTVLAKSGLAFSLVISIRYKPIKHELGMLHQEIGENYLNVVVIPEIEGVLRQTIGKLKTEEVYTTNPHLLDTFNKIIDLELSRKTKSHHHIIYEEVIIKNITLPTAYRNAS